MKKLAFAAAVLFTSLTIVTSNKNGGLNNSLKPNDVTVQTADLSNDVNQLAPNVLDRANLAQADGKANY